MTAAAPRPARLLVAVDDSRESDHTVAFAGLLARALAARVALLSTDRVARRRDLLFDLAERLLDLPGDATPERRARPGVLERVLPDECRAWEADMAVVGRFGTLHTLLHGLVAKRLVSAVPCSLLQTRARPLRLRRVLLCTSGPMGEDTVRTAFAIARAAGARLAVLHVLSQMRVETARFEEERDMVEELIKLEQEVRSHLDDVRERAGALGVALDVKVRTGLVEEEIAAEAKEGDYDLVIVGAHKAQPGAFLLRDIADWIVNHVDRPTLVVKSPLPA